MLKVIHIVFVCFNRDTCATKKTDQTSLSLQSILYIVSIFYYISLTLISISKDSSVKDDKLTDPG